MSRRLALSAFLTAGVLAIGGCGGDESSGPSAGTAAGNSTDRAFAAEMVPHHESGVEMAAIARERGESEYVRQLAEDIVRTQTAEIATLRREDAELADAGVKKGSLGVAAHAMGMDGDTERLGKAKPFDPSFIEMMVPHHEGAIEMAKVELARGRDPELKATAQSIIDSQQREIDGMERAARQD